MITDKVQEAITLSNTLVMARQSLSPEKFESFIEIYNELINTRDLELSLE